MILYKYHGAGNDFLIVDNRDGSIHLSINQIQLLCDRHLGIGSDGLMLLNSSEEYSFAMEYYNPDGSSGMMCGNGGRCIVAFAADCGITDFNFLAPDGVHSAEIISGDIHPQKQFNIDTPDAITLSEYFGQKQKNGLRKIIKLKMKDVSDYQIFEDGIFMDTGTRHFVRFVDDVQNLCICDEGREIRYQSRFAPIGVNVNFVHYQDDVLYVRTYEKGVEAETLACGTGIVASALCSYIHNQDNKIGLSQSVKVRSKVDNLQVSFTPNLDGDKYKFTDIYLTGPATFVAKIEDFLL